MQKIRLIVSVLALIALCSSSSIVSAADTKELQLAGIRLGRSALTIIKLYGNPTEIRVGGRGAQAGTGQEASQQPYTGGFPEGPPPGMGGTTPAFPGVEGPPPGIGNIGTPMTPTGQAGATQAQGARKPTGTEVTWVYKFPKNRILEFIINPDGYVIQIAAFGVDWPGIVTSKGIKLGSTYKDVILKYGYPESHQQSGYQMVTKYVERNRVAFTFVGKTVVGITIALWDTD